MPNNVGCRTESANSPSSTLNAFLGTYFYREWSSSLPSTLCESLRNLKVQILIIVTAVGRLFRFSDSLLGLLGVWFGRTGMPKARQGRGRPDFASLATLFPFVYLDNLCCTSSHLHGGLLALIHLRHPCYVQRRSAVWFLCECVLVYVVE